MKNQFVYLDNSATTQVDPRVLDAMLPYFGDNFGNASSLHQLGVSARSATSQAQKILANFLGCEETEVFFTSGATESDNMAIFGIINALTKKNPGKKYHIITSAIEHDAILEPCQYLAKLGVEVTYLPVNEGGMVEVKSLRSAIKDNTVLVSIMYVNNEIGTIQPIQEMGELIAQINKKREQKIYFHTDATQALLYCDCRVENLGVDLLSLSGHKIYGPKGVGALFVKKGVKLEPMIFGGHQQADVRPGTYNVPSIVGLGRAVEIISDQSALMVENQTIKSLRDGLIEKILGSIDKAMVTGDLINRVPSNASFIFPGVEGESMLLMLSDSAVAVSTGSACSSGSLEPSHVLMAIGVKPEMAHGSLRVTLGRFTTQADIEKLLTALPPIVKRLREMSPLKAY